MCKKGDWWRLNFVCKIAIVIIEFLLKILLWIYYGVEDVKTEPFETWLDFYRFSEWIRRAWKTWTTKKVKAFPCSLLLLVACKNVKHAFCFFAFLPTKEKSRENFVGVFPNLLNNIEIPFHLIKAFVLLLSLFNSTFIQAFARCRQQKQLIE